jgi:hypothetical protein
VAEKLEGLFPFALHGADVGDLGQKMDPAALSAVCIRRWEKCRPSADIRSLADGRR